MSVYVPIAVDVPIDVYVSINVGVSVDVYVPVDLDVTIYVSVDVGGSVDVGVFTAVVPVAITVSVIVLAVSWRHNYTTATVMAIAVMVATVIAAVVIATGTLIRIDFTRLKSQYAEGQRKDRKQWFHTSVVAIVIGPELFVSGSNVDAKAIVCFGFGGR
jgi:hypothetical protein